MNFKHLSPLLFSTVLASTSAVASQGVLSDAYNGINWPQEGFPAWKAGKLTQFQEKAGMWASITQQAETYHAPLTRKGGDAQKIQANAICDFLAAKNERALFSQQLFASFNENGPPAFDGIGDMKDGPIRNKGRHVALVREVEDLDKQITNISSSIEDRPALRDELLATNQSHISRKEELLNLNAELEEKIRQLNEAVKIQTEAVELDSQQQGELKNKIGQLSKIFEEINSEEEKELEPHKQAQTELEQKLDTLKAEQQALEVELEGLKPDITPEVDNNLEEGGGDKESEAVEKVDGQEDAHIQEEVLEDKAESNAAIEKLESQIEELKGNISTQEIELVTNTELQKGIKAKYEGQRQKPSEERKSAKSELDVIDAQIASKTQTLNETQKELNEAEKSLASNREEIIELDVKITAHNDSVEDFDKETSALNLNLRLANASRQAKQAEADIYALIKYLTYMNVLSVFPTDDWDQDEEWHLQSIPQAYLPMVRKLMDHRANKVAADNAKLISDRETQNLVKMISGTATPLQKSALGKATSINKYDDYRNDTVSAVKAIGAVLEEEQIFSDYHKSDEGKNRYHYYPMKMDDDAFSAEINGPLDKGRLDRLLKARALKWKGRISTNANSMAMQMGLTSSLMREGYLFARVRSLISLEDLIDSFNGEFKPYALEKGSGYWGLAAHQLETTYAKDWHDTESEVHKRVTPVYNFVKAKAEKEVAKKKQEAPALQDKKEQDPSIRAFVKLVSYMSMLKALQENESGQKAKPILLVDPHIAPLLKVPVSDLQGVDKILANKAMKWADRLWSNGQKFIEAKGLKGWIFAEYENLFEDEYDGDN